MRNDKIRQLDKEVEKTLASFDDVEDIEVSPFFYTRLKANLESSPETGLDWLQRLLLPGRRAPALLATVVAVNILTAVVLLRQENRPQTESGIDYTSVVADEYHLTAPGSWLDIGGE